MLQNRLFAITAGSPLISACSSIVDDNHQNIAVDTDPQGARCVLENKQGKFHVPETPGTVMISMSWDDLALADSLFEPENPPPDPALPQPDWVAGLKGDYLYAHITSPDVHIDAASGPERGGW